MCVCEGRTEQCGAAGLQQRQQSEQQCQPPQRPESPAPHREEGGQLGGLLRETSAGPRGSPLLLGNITVHGMCWQRHIYKDMLAFLSMKGEFVR